MASGLVKLGMLLLAVALVGLLLAATGVRVIEPLKDWIRLGLLAGTVLIVGGIGVAALGRVGRVALPARCARCARSVERGQVYCADHLKLTVDEARDALHLRNLDRGAHG